MAQVKQTRPLSYPAEEAPRESRHGVNTSRKPSLMRRLGEIALGFSLPDPPPIPRSQVPLDEPA
jgi:hypothetical protein